ncbi:hypothetical protein QUG69_23940, partial [Enterobacter hormaechei]|uniref:hypothetical protein n=1 Tax=Enterobacter hormaechei TaxID=158836 RepID=UPI0025A1CB66
DNASLVLAIIQDKIKDLSAIFEPFCLADHIEAHEMGHQTIRYTIKRNGFITFVFACLIISFSVSR